MTELVNRCVDAAIAVPDHDELGPDYNAIVRAVLAEAGKALLSDEAVADAWSALFDAGGSGNEQGVRAAINAALVKIGANQ